MLKTMRQHARYFYVLFFIVILTFIFWGVGTIDQNPQNIVAEVGSYKISAQEYWRQYDRALKFYREIYQDNFNEEMQEKLKIKDNVLNSLIDSKVLLIAAKQHCITATNEELHEAIINEPSFLRDGVFDRQVYLNALRISRISPETYESLKRQELVITKVRRLIELSANIPESELDLITADEQTLNSIKEAVINDSKEKALQSYINGLKKNIPVKIYNELI